MSPRVAYGVRMKWSNAWRRGFRFRVQDWRYSRDDAFHDKTSREDVAYHEAGHAVAHWRHDYDRPVDKVTVKPGEGYLGRVESTLPPQVMAAIDRGEEWTAEVDGLIGREVIATLAGPAAEARHRGRENPAGAGSDHRTVMGFAYRCGMEGDLAAAFFEYRNLRARQLVEVNWKLIEAVAAALLERETLSGDECWAVIREAWGAE